jgi:ribosomal protein L14E/L6E/L27E
MQKIWKFKNNFGVLFDARDKAITFIKQTNKDTRIKEKPFIIALGHHNNKSGWTNEWEAKQKRENPKYSNRKYETNYNNNQRQQPKTATETTTT